MLQSKRRSLRRNTTLSVWKICNPFEKIYAPFDGVITARNTDVGQLIDSGSSGGPARELFHIAAIRTLRVFINVPQQYSVAAKPGIGADLDACSVPGPEISGEIGAHRERHRPGFAHIIG